MVYKRSKKGRQPAERFLLSVEDGRGGEEKYTMLNTLSCTTSCLFLGPSRIIITLAKIELPNAHRPERNKETVVPNHKMMEAMI